MIKFLLDRPIAVNMALLAVVILGVIAKSMLPVSLMPDIDIPHITVQLSDKNTTARQLENSVVNPLRRHLMHTAHLSDIESETRDGASRIKLSFEYGTNIDLAFIEVNEKIDLAMASFPKEVQRPRVVKASAIDIPVYFLHVTLKNDTNTVAPGSASSLGRVSQGFLNLSTFTNQVICKRIEQLPSVAIADMSGLAYPELIVQPHSDIVNALNISFAQLEQAIIRNNVDLGNLLIQDGQYQYNVRLSSRLRNKKDIEELYIDVGGRLLQIKEIATVVERPQPRQGFVTFNGRDAISIAVIKQSDVQMKQLTHDLNQLEAALTHDYPHIDFSISRDQTQLLAFSISNLYQNLIWGGILAFGVMLLFLGELKSPLLIGISLPVSLIVSLFCFYMMGISINIISLSGLALGLGMMVDNSIIVIDNIVQHRERGSAIVTSCINGTNEVFRPMLSSMLTSCAVFLPLIFLSGISGALFYDQAVAVVIGHFASLLVSVTVIPVYYNLFYKRDHSSTLKKWLTIVDRLGRKNFYEKGFKWTLRHQKLIWISVAICLMAGVFTFTQLPRSSLPHLTKDEMVVELKWNESIHVEENGMRVNKLVAIVDEFCAHYSCLIGEQQFMLNHEFNTNSTESTVYIKAKSPEALAVAKSKLHQYISSHYPKAVFAFKDPTNLFNAIFPENTPALIAQLRSIDGYSIESRQHLERILNDVQATLQTHALDKIRWQEHTVLKASPEKLMIYDLTHESLYRELLAAFSQNQILVIKEDQTFVPLIVGDSPKLMSDILDSMYIANREGDRYPVRELVEEVKEKDFEVITAGQEGQYFPLDLKLNGDNWKEITKSVSAVINPSTGYEVDYSGSVFSDTQLVEDLILILVISLVLLYFILAAQFESLLLPIIILLEVPIDIAGSLLFLKLFGAGINLMSLIGIVVMTGIVINDSILKIDTTLQLRREGHSLLKSMMLGGRRRLKSILMTSLTTVLAMSPLIFAKGMGSELQRPLAIALAGGMIVGTIVSLYFIPLCYYYLSSNIEGKLSIGEFLRSK